MTCWALAEELRKRSRGFFEFIMPAIDMVERGNELIIWIDLPGFAKEGINLNIIEDILTVNAKRKEEEEQQSETQYYKQRPLQINRKVALPFSTKDGETIVGTAKYEDGVIILRIPIPRSSYIPIT
jgi:HSP20 family molecular chaperone IbpA